ncbi:MAG: 6-phosphogluconolactonase [Halioglobus sp.]
MNDKKNYPDQDQLNRELAAHICDVLSADVEKTGSASLAVSGGNTPKGLFRCLSMSEISWEKVTIVLVDERWVDTQSPDSNERLVREHLAQNAALETLVVGLKTDHQRAEDGLREAQQRISLLTKPFTAVILGMGGDGHTASWFPKADNLKTLLDPENTDEVAITDPVTAPHKRATLTLSAVLNSREVIVHITGDEKRAVFESAQDRGHPIAAILEQSKTPVTLWWAP